MNAKTPECPFCRALGRASPKRIEKTLMYWKHFGLQQAPFNITPDPAYVFFSRQHKEVLHELLYGIQTRKGFMELTGTIGAGKTTIYRTLLQRIDKQVESALILNPSLSSMQLLQTVIEDFHIEVSTNNRKAMFDALNSFLLKTAEAGSTAVLIIDEAQDLKAGTLEQIRLLSNFETNKDKLLQIILVGQPELRTLLAKPSLEQIRQRITVSTALEPLGREEVGMYIKHRIWVAGGDSMLIFDNAAVDEIFRISGGVPRKINVICDRALFMAYMQDTEQDISMLTARN